ncbi:MAG: phosphoglycerate dehydrogenase [Promethearchaeota archaeon]
MQKQNSKFKVIIAESMAEDGPNLLRYSPNFDIIILDKKERDKLEREIANADAIVVRSGVKVDENLILKAKKLKIVGRAGAGYDNIDVATCSKKGIVVMIAPAGNTNGVVELTISLMLSLFRNIIKADKTMKEGIWAKKQLIGRELKGKTLGLIGLGKIGRRVAEISKFLGMNILALVANKHKKRNLNFEIELVDSLEEMLPNVDILSIHVPLNENTRNMIGEKELKRMKKSAFIINTSRGAIIDEEALYNALKDGVIAGAAIDVYSKEPANPEQFPFISLENVIALPHLGASTFESQANVSRIICNNIMIGLEENIYIDAVNLPFSIPAQEAKIYAPYIKLSKRLGKFVGQYCKDEVSEINIFYRQSAKLELAPIIVSCATEILKEKDPNVSIINVTKIIENKGIKLNVALEEDPTYNDVLKLNVKDKSGNEIVIKATLVADIPKLIEIQGIKLEVVLAGKMILIRNLNVPGVIGKIGSLLGGKKINISEMHLGRSEVGGETKGIIMIDEPVSDAILEEIKSLENVVDVRQILLD